jgi:hypothetical protein
MATRVYSDPATDLRRRAVRQYGSSAVKERQENYFMDEGASRIRRRSWPGSGAAGTMHIVIARGALDA